MKNVIMLILAMLMINTAFANNENYSLSVAPNKQHEEVPFHHQYVFIDSTLINIANNNVGGVGLHSVHFCENVGSCYNLMQTFNIPIRAELVVKSEESTIKNNFTDFYDNPFRQPNQELHKKLHTIMLNAYYDFYNGTNFTPYVSLSMGAGVVKFNHQIRFLGNKTALNDTLFDLLKNNNSHLVYALGLGSSYSITPHWSADIGAKYFYGSNNEEYNSGLNTQPNRKTPLNSIDVAFGMTYRF